MKKIGRNDPCPCGSGKKYKNCCLGKNAQPHEENPAQQVMGEIREVLNKQEFDSLDDAQVFLDRFVESKNRVPQINFLGLSSDQVYRMMYHPLEDLGDMLRFNHQLESEVFQDIPIVKNTLFFLTRLNDLEPLKTTAKGNLPLAFARELHDQYVDSSSDFQFKIRSEEESISVNSLRHVLRMCGWVKKEKNCFSLTKKGRGLVARGFIEAHFFTLLNVFTRRFNWAFQDGYPPLWIIQGGFVFSLYLVHRKARHFIKATDLGDYFIKAFPTTLSEFEGIRFFDPSDTVKNCFSLRFLEYFCEYFGFADTRREKKTPYGFHLFVKKSAFYDKFINWSNFS
ncbi:MAG: SEC-C domain-containing protein [Deltaproteobacteria bacterium]|nr:SEC-C domain-containing protein [Deltaproteobacteria bacterium]